MPRGILKFTRLRTLEDVVKQIDIDNLTKGFRDVAPKLPDYVAREDWTGVIFFDVGVNFKNELLQRVLPDEVQDALRFSFVSISPKLPGTGDGAGYSVAANISWQNKSPSLAGAAR